ncbi:MAG: hypothetical protein ACYDH0_06430 [Candidatus Aminicenantales bacterium]
MNIKARWAITTALVVLMSPVALDAQVVENPAVPRAKNAGRVVVPTEVLSISDEGTGDFYFKVLFGLTAGPDGSIVVRGRDQLLHFDANGKFLRDYFKKGQGPGEMQSVIAWFQTDRDIVVQAYPPKFLWFDLQGNLEREMPLSAQATIFAFAIASFEGVFYLYRPVDPREEGEWHVVDIPNAIISLDKTTGATKTLSSFPTKAHTASLSGSGGATSPISRFIAVPFGGQFLALSHTSEYLLKIYDPGSDKVVREFRRPYERVKAGPRDEGGGVLFNKPGGKASAPPRPKYRNDILNILVRGDRIWAVTSTRDEKKGILIDVFDADGFYQDAFYLKLPEPALNSLELNLMSEIRGDSLWLIETTEDFSEFTIRKYRIE